MNLSMKQKWNHVHREQAGGCQGGGLGEGWSGRLGWQMQTTIYRMDKQQGSTV